jgi:hypothetical protein
MSANLLLEAEEYAVIPQQSNRPLRLLPVQKEKYGAELET